MIPSRCPKCGTKICQEIVRLAEGGFLFKETCSANNVHYNHYREPDLVEIHQMVEGGGNGDT